MFATFLSQFSIVLIPAMCTSIRLAGKDVFIVYVFSDLTIKLKGKELPGHKFVLAARSDYWGTENLSDVSVLDLSGKMLFYDYLSSHYISSSMLLCPVP